MDVLLDLKNVFMNTVKLKCVRGHLLYADTVIYIEQPSGRPRIECKLCRGIPLE